MRSSLEYWTIELLVAELSTGRWSSSGLFDSPLGTHWSLSSPYMCTARLNCRMLFWQAERRARSLAPDNAGSSSAARMAMIATTTSNSISVNARARRAHPRTATFDL